MEEKRDAYRVLVGKSEGRRPLGRPRRRRKNNIKWIFENWDWSAWIGITWLGIGTGNWLL
jgi:hypothetical protein